jgi:FtsP/CotA-like multicopper oxidase with cupredoxin domain
MLSIQGWLVSLCLLVLIQEVYGDYGCEQQCAGPDTDVFYHLQATVDSYVIRGSHAAFDQEDDVTYTTRTWKDNGSTSDFCVYNDGDNGILGPCMEAKPGQRVSVMVTNNMEDYGPEKPSLETWQTAIRERYNSSYMVEKGFVFYNKPPANDSGYVKDEENMPHDFSDTNLHLHGVQVGPHMYYPQGTAAEDSDWVTIEPSGAQKCMCYQFDIPVGHPEGLFLYHIHRHGSAAMQGWSGMFGFFMIQGSNMLESQLSLNYNIDVPVIPFLIWDPHLSITGGGDERRRALRPGVSDLIKGTPDHARVSKQRERELSLSLKKPRESPQVTDVEVTDFIHGQTDDPDATLFLVNNDYQPTFANIATKEVTLIRVVCVTTENLCSFKIVNTEEPGKDVPFYVVSSDGILYSEPVKQSQLFLAGGMREVCVCVCM